MHPHRQLPRLFRSPTSETVPRAKNRLAITPTTEREIAAHASDVLTSSVIAIAADEAAMLLLFMLTLTANSAQHLTQPRCVSAERTTVPGME